MTAVLWAAQKGITGGMSDTLFAPNSCLHQSADCHFPVARGGFA